jgi:hypothetical protein
MDEIKTVVNPESDSPVVVSRSEYRGEARLDVRQYFYSRDGELLPTKKGVSLPIATGLARQVLDVMRAVIHAGNGNDGDTVLDEEAGCPLVVKLSAFRGRLYLDVRRYYGDTADLRPTRKGVSLPVDTGLHERVMLAMAELLTDKVEAGA